MTFVIPPISGLPTLPRIVRRVVVAPERFLPVDSVLMLCKLQNVVADVIVEHRDMTFFLRQSKLEPKPFIYCCSGHVALLPDQIHHFMAFDS